MAVLVYPCGCKIDFEGNHCCDAHTIDLCLAHQAELKKIEEREFQWRSKWNKEHPIESYALAQLYLNAMSKDSEGLIVRDLVDCNSRDWSILR
jgi:hypothetical protein